MTRKRKSERNRDGIVIRDQWAMKGLHEGKRWLYRVWDPTVKKYKSQAFLDDPAKDSNRKGPGCSAGDEWSSKQIARFRLGQDSAAITTLKDAGDSYLASREALGRSASQLGIIKHVLERACAAGITDLSDHRVPDIAQRWLGKLLNSQRGFVTGKNKKLPDRTPASPRSKNKYLTVLRSIGNHAVKRRMMTYNPFAAVERFAEPKRFRRGYSIAELRLMLSDDFYADHWWPFIALAAYTGLRSETLRSLTWDMVGWEADRIRVPAEITKANSDIRVPIQPELRDLLQAKPGVGKSPILPKSIAKMNSDQANLETQAFLNRCGITPDGRSVHAFRHTVASLLTATGLSPFLVMDAIGHLSHQTSKHYSRGADEYRVQVKKEGWEEGEFMFRRSISPKINVTM